MEMVLNTETFEVLDQQKMLETEGGLGVVGQFVISYAVGKAIDWTWSHRSEIARSIAQGPSRKDPMRQTAYYSIFSGR